MPPVIAVVGHSQSGKTTLIEGLLLELRDRGYRVASIKHTLQPVELDKAGKDSSRHIQAGSQETALVTPKGVAVIHPTAEMMSVEDVLQMLSEEYDLVIAEGFKESNLPKIEMRLPGSEGHSEEWTHVIAVVSDEPAETEGRYFSPRDIKPLADFIENGFIKPQQGLQLSLYVNGKAVKVNSYIKELIGSILTAMVSTLKGVDTIEQIDLRLRKTKS